MALGKEFFETNDRFEPWDNPIQLITFSEISSSTIMFSMFSQQHFFLTEEKKNVSHYRNLECFCRKEALHLNLIPSRQHEIKTSISNGKNDKWKHLVIVTKQNLQHQTLLLLKCPWKWKYNTSSSRDLKPRLPSPIWVASACPNGSKAIIPENPPTTALASVWWSFDVSSRCDRRHSVGLQ